METNVKANISGRGERYLCFALGEESYAIPLLSVKEVIAVPEVTPVPQTPNYFLGIMNLRGQIISVLDLRTKFGIEPASENETSVIICDLQPNCIGVVVDSIDSVLSPTADEISDKPTIQSQRNTDYIQGVFRHKERLILLLDIMKTLDSADHQNVTRLTQARPAAPKVA